MDTEIITTKILSALCKLQKDRPINYDVITFDETMNDTSGLSNSETGKKLLGTGHGVKEIFVCLEYLKREGLIEYKINGGIGSNQRNIANIIVRKHSIEHIIDNNIKNNKRPFIINLFFKIESIFKISPM